jgi:hypothetical protein
MSETIFSWPVSELAPAAVCKALDALALRIAATGFEGIAVGMEANIRFAVGDKSLTEREFYNELVGLNMTASAPSLRRLITAYLDRGETGEGEYPICHSGEWSTAPCGFALRAIVLLDKGATDLVRRYLEATDLEHDGFAVEEPFAAYVKKYGFKSDDDLRFGVFSILTASNSASGHGLWKSCGIITGARQLMSGKQFAELLNSEIEVVHAFQIEDDFDPEGLESALEDLVESLREALDPDSSWASEFYATLAMRWPPIRDALA